MFSKFEIPTNLRKMDVYKKDIQTLKKTKKVLFKIFEDRYIFEEGAYWGM